MNLRELAEKILDRKIESNEGIRLSNIENFEKKSGIDIPSKLKEFYSILGNTKLFTDGFQRFADLPELFVKDNKLVFLQENQSVLYWGIDLRDKKSIYQTTDQDFKNEVQWYKEDFELSDFLEMMLFFQSVISDESYHIKSNSGFQYFASLDEEKYKDNIERENFTNHLETDFEVITNGNGISIYWKKNAIIMLLLNKEYKVDMILSSIKNESYLALLIEKYGFGEL